LVEVFEDSCFSNCRRLQWVGFERGVRLRQIGREIFTGSGISPMGPLNGF
jgi:hypothetical protein